MKVTFACTQEEIVDASMRILARSKTIRISNWKAMLWGAVLLGPLMGLILHGLIGFWPLSVFMGLFAVLAVFALGPSSLEHSRRKNLARFVREKYGDQNSFPCEVELANNGVSVIGENSQHLFAWGDLEEIVVTADSVDIFTKRGGGVVVRDRAFASPDTRAEFIELAQHHFSLAHPTTT